MILTPLLALALTVEPLHQDPDEDLLRGWQHFWIAAQVMEETEREWYFRYPYSLESDLEVMRHREAAVNTLTPPGSYPVPPADLCRNNWKLSRSFVTYLERCLQNCTEPAHEQSLHLLLWEARWRAAVWSELDDAQPGRIDPLGKRLHLERLRELIGPTAFDLHQFPDPLPKAAFTGDWNPNSNPYTGE